MKIDDAINADSSWEVSLPNSKYVDRLWKYWAQQAKNQSEENEQVDVQFQLDKSETEILLEKSSSWSIINQTMTTKPSDYQYYVEIRKRVGNQKNYIESLLKSEVYEAGEVSEVQRYIERQLKKDKNGMQSVLQTIYLENYSQVSVFVNLLQVISQIDYKMIEPAGPIMALAATRHENCEVREFGLRCFENWEDLSCLSVLKSLYFEEKWLQNYLEMLIEDLEEED